MAELSNNIGKLAQENEDGEDALNLVETESGAARPNRGGGGHDRRRSKTLERSKSEWSDFF